MTRILAAAALGCAVAMTQAAEYRLVKANDTSKNPYTEANAPTYWQTLAGAPASGAVTDQDVCYLDSSTALTIGGSFKLFPGKTLSVGRVEDGTVKKGNLYVRANLTCADLQWPGGNVYDGSPSSLFVIDGGTVTVTGGASTSHNMYFSAAAPSTTTGWGFDFSSKLVGPDPDTTIRAYLASGATDDCHGKDDPYPYIDALMSFSGDNSGYAGRFVINTFGHLAFKSDLSAGAPESPVANKIELGANGRLAVQSGVTLNRNCGITVTGEGAKLMAKKYMTTTGVVLGDCADSVLPMPIAGGYGLTKDGDGTVTLAGAYSAGDLVVAAGTLVLGEGSSFPNGQKVTVKAGATLLQKVYVAGLDVTCEAGGTYVKDVKYVVPYENGVTEPLDLRTLPVAELPDSIQLSRSIALPLHEGLRLDLAKLPEGATADGFRDATEKTYGLPKTSFVLEEREEGARMLVLAVRPVAVSVAEFPNNSLGLNGTAANWSNGEEAKPGLDYLVTNRVDGLGSSFNGDSVTFSLTPSISIVNLRQKTSCLKDATAYPGIEFHPLIGSTPVFSFSAESSLNVVDDGSGKSVSFVTPWADGGQRMMRMMVNVPISGNAPVLLKTLDPKARVIDITGDNSTFTGTITVGADKLSKDVPDQTEFHVGQASSLGGALKTFNATALTLDQQSLLFPDQTMTLKTANRGIYVKDGGFRVTNDVTLTILEPLRVKNVFLKQGAGTLALGGAISYGTDGNGTSGSLTVEAGAVTPLCDAAVAGLAVSFAAGTAVTLDPTVTTADGFTGGVTASGTVAVGMDAAKAVRGTTYTLPICTCASDAPDLTEVFVPARIRGYTGRIEKVDAGGDRVRYQLVAEPSGLILFVR